MRSPVPAAAREASSRTGSAARRTAPRGTTTSAPSREEGRVERGERRAGRSAAWRPRCAAATSEPAASASARLPATHAGRQRRDPRVLRRELAIDEDQAVAARVGRGLDLGGGRPSGLRQRLEVAADERRDVGEAPVLVRGSWGSRARRSARGPDRRRAVTAAGSSPAACAGAREVGARGARRSVSGLRRVIDGRPARGRRRDGARARASSSQA